MTKNNSLKTVIRNRMAATGESYAVALRKVEYFEKNWAELLKVTGGFNTGVHLITFRPENNKMQNALAMVQQFTSRGADVGWVGLELGYEEFIYHAAEALMKMHSFPDKAAAHNFVGNRIAFIPDPHDFHKMKDGAIEKVLPIPNPYVDYTLSQIRAIVQEWGINVVFVDNVECFIDDVDVALQKLKKLAEELDIAILVMGVGMIQGRNSETKKVFQNTYVPNLYDLVETVSFFSNSPYPTEIGIFVEYTQPEGMKVEGWQNQFSLART